VVTSERKTPGGGGGARQGGRKRGVEDYLTGTLLTAAFIPEKEKKMSKMSPKLAA